MFFIHIMLFLALYLDWVSGQFRNHLYQQFVVMLDRNKNKIKIEIGKALQTVSNIVKPSSEVRQLLDSTQKDVTLERSEKIHQTLIDTEDGREFIISEIARDPKSYNYRSPYTNRYYPTHKEDMFMLSPLLRELEEKGNILFEEYGRLYYGDGCITTFYAYETEQGLNFALYVKKTYKEQESNGVWSSSNLVQIRGDPSKSVSYKLQTSVLYEMNVVDEATQQLTEIYGSVKKNRVESKRWTPDYEIDEFHLQMVGKLIEQVETYLRQQIENVFARKTKEIIFKTRFINTKEEEENRKKRGQELAKMRAQSNRAVADA